MTVSTSAESASLEFNWIRRLPIIRQAEAAECGLACLAMIARYRGVDTDLITLRRNHRGSGRGHTLKDLIDIATQINLSARPVRVPLEAIPQLQCPCILHWDMNHFVVLKSVGRRHAVIHNPARGVEKLDAAEFSKHFTGVALELLPTGTLKKQARAQRLRLADLWSSIVGLKRSLAHILFLSLLLQLFAVAAVDKIGTLRTNGTLMNIGLKSFLYVLVYVLVMRLCSMMFDVSYCHNILIKGSLGI